MTAFAYGWFDWPDGSVLTNLVASAICAAFAIRWVGRWLGRFHARLDSHDEKLDRIHEHLGIVRPDTQTTANPGDKHR